MDVPTRRHSAGRRPHRPATRASPRGVAFHGRRDLARSDPPYSGRYRTRLPVIIPVDTTFRTFCSRPWRWRALRVTLVAARGTGRNESASRLILFGWWPAGPWFWGVALGRWPRRLGDCVVRGIRGPGHAGGVDRRADEDTDRDCDRNLPAGARGLTCWGLYGLDEGARRVAVMGVSGVTAAGLTERNGSLL